MIGRRRWTPWLWLIPSLALVGVFLVYPVVRTIMISFMDADVTTFVGWDNYLSIFTHRDTLIVLRNNALWLIVFTLTTVVLGLTIAVLNDRVPYSFVIRTAIFLPMSVSFVAAGVIWTFMYRYQPDLPGFTQTGTINAVITALGGEPVAWLVDHRVNNYAIIFAGIWIWTGFAMVILSAGLKGIPQEIMDSARVDGATEFQIFRRIIIPLLWPTIIVVAVTLMINALKIFDLVYIMTGGRFDTGVIATRMWREMFVFSHFGRASALAVILFVTVVPIVVFNIRRFLREE